MPLGGSTTHWLAPPCDITSIPLDFVGDYLKRFIFIGKFLKDLEIIQPNSKSLSVNDIFILWVAFEYTHEKSD